MSGFALAVALLCLTAVTTEAQAPSPAESPAPAQEPPHDHAAMLAAQAGRWQLMWDGNLFATLNDQGGVRGGDNEVRAQNWLMLMGSRQFGRGTLALSAMASLEPVTIGGAGYAHLFQRDETYRGLPVTDRQHPHDLFMQIDAAWRVPIGRTEFSISGGPVGAPAFGPTAFMHRLSSEKIPARRWRITRSIPRTSPWAR